MLSGKSDVRDRLAEASRSLEVDGRDLSAASSLFVVIVEYLGELACAIRTGATGPARPLAFIRSVVLDAGRAAQLNIGWSPPTNPDTIHLSASPADGLSMLAAYFRCAGVSSGDFCRLKNPGEYEVRVEVHLSVDGGLTELVSTRVPGGQEVEVQIVLP